MARTEVTGSQIKDQSVSLTLDVTGILPVANGGTGSNTLALNNVLLGNGTGALQAVAPGAAANVLRSTGSTWASAALTKSDVGLANVDNTSDATKNSATATLTNKTISGASNTLSAIPQSAVTNLQTALQTDQISANTGTQLVLNGGDSVSAATGQTGEIVYINAEGGLQVNSSPDNWVGGWAVRKTATICDSSGNSSFPGSISATSLAGSIATGTGASGTWGIAITGNAATATTLATARTIGGVSFNGSANINLPGVNTAGTQNTTGTAANITGTAAIANGGTGQTTAAAAITALTGTQTAGRYLRSDGTNATLSTIQAADVPTLNQNTTGSAATLTTARTINGVSFNGSANITVADSTKEPVITAGTTAQYWRGDKSFQTLDKTAVGLGNVTNVAQEPTITAGTTAQYWRGDKSWQTLNATAVGLGNVTNVAASTTATASSIAQRDANNNLLADNFIPTITSTATAAAITTLDLSATQIQVFTGTTTQTVKLPTTGVQAGQSYTVVNNSTGTVTVQSSAGNEITVMQPNRVSVYTALVSAPTTDAHWAGSSLAAGKVFKAISDLTLQGTDGTSFTFPTASGTVLTADSTATVSNKNLTGTGNTFPTFNQNTTGTAANVTGTVAVANGGTGATTLTGLVKGSGTSAFTAAVAGTDYVAPSGTINIGTTAVTINRASSALTLAGVSLSTLTIGTGLSGTSYNGSAAVTVAIDSTVATLTGTQTLTNKTLTSPRLGTLLDTNGNTAAWFGGTASAVNFMQMGNSATGTRPLLRAQGSDANVGLSICPKGTGTVVLLDSAFQFILEAVGVTSSANSLIAGNAATGTDPYLQATGTDAVVGLNLRTKSTGTVKANGVEVATISGTQTLTNKSINLANNTLTTTLAQLETAVTDAVLVDTVLAQTLTNKRVTPRINSTTSTATPSINTDTTDQYNITALAVAITSVTVTGTPTDGQRLMVRIKGDATPRAIAWGASFVASGVAPLLTTTVASKTHLCSFLYDSAAAKWVAVATDDTGY